MNFELEEHEARYLAFSLAVHIARAEERLKDATEWVEGSGSLDGDYGVVILNTDVAYLDALRGTLDANKAVLARLVSQLPETPE